MRSREQAHAAQDAAPAAPGARCGVVPAIGLGTWQLTGRRCREVVQLALELGYRHVDTAQGYGNETEVGAALSSSGLPREELFVTTKAWPDDLVQDADCVQRSVDRLGQGPVDLLLMHWPSPALPLEPTLDALGRAAEQGLARAVGVSNFPPGLLAAAARRLPLAADQVELHVFLGQRRLLACARSLGVPLMAYCPLARGRIRDEPLLAALAARHGVSPAQVALRWLLQRGVAVVPKASSREHLAANLDLDGFALAPQEMAAIDRLERGKRLIDPGFAPDWEA